jgi:hypothetical protein
MWYNGEDGRPIRSPFISKPNRRGFLNRIVTSVNKEGTVEEERMVVELSKGLFYKDQMISIEQKMRREDGEEFFIMTLRGADNKMFLSRSDAQKVYGAFSLNLPEPAHRPKGKSRDNPLSGKAGPRSFTRYQPKDEDVPW